jgi:serine/threonine-protein kinase
VNWVGHEIGGKYKLERVLGEGGMGIVYLARHTELGHPVAIKALKRLIADEPEARGRFEREARAAACLTSEHVAHVTDVGRMPDDTPFMVMEYLEGEDLSARIEREGALAPSFAVECILQACDGLEEAHQKGIVHRDVKPANLFLVRKPNGRVMVKVLDFGIAKAASFGRGELTQTSNVLGSPLYMSPEQLRASKDVDARSDVWSVGVTLFYLLTKRVPFEAEGIGEIAAKILYAEPLALSLFAPDLPTELETLILACLKKDPHERIGSIGELIGRLAEFRGPTLSAGRFAASPTLSMREAAAVRAAAGKSGAIDTLPLDIRKGEGALPMDRVHPTETLVMDRPVPSSEPAAAGGAGASTMLMGAPPVHTTDATELAIRARASESEAEETARSGTFDAAAPPARVRERVRGPLVVAGLLAVLGVGIGVRGLVGRSGGAPAMSAPRALIPAEVPSAATPEATGPSPEPSAVPDGTHQAADATPERDAARDSVLGASAISGPRAATGTGTAARPRPVPTPPATPPATTGTPVNASPPRSAVAAGAPATVATPASTGAPAAAPPAPPAPTKKGGSVLDMELQ